MRILNMKTMKIYKWAMLVFAMGTWITCRADSSPPLPQDAENVLRQQIDSESQGFIKLVSFKKTDGLMSVVNAVQVYEMDYEAEFEFTSSGTWVKGMQGMGFGFSTQVANPGSWAAFANQNVNGGIPVHNGDHVRIAGVMQGIKKESGWKLEQGDSHVISGPAGGIVSPTGGAAAASTSSSILAKGFTVVTSNSFVEYFASAPSYTNNWQISTITGDSSVNCTYGNLRMQASRKNSSVTLLSTFSYAGDVDFSVQLNHQGYGRTIIGLWSTNSNNWLANACLDTDDTDYLAFGSGSFTTENKYSGKNYMNRWINLRIRITGDLVEFFANGVLLASTHSATAGAFRLALTVGSVPWKSGDNNTSFSYIVATGQCAGLPKGNVSPLPLTFEELLPKAQAGNADAQFKLGITYENGKSGTTNFVEAVKWFRKAADQGSVPAEAALGGSYKFGRGVDKDYAESLNWFRKAADQGYSRAQFNVGLMYENGWGVETNYAEAKNWFQKASEQGVMGAKSELEKMNKEPLSQ
jgi:hypothetical protein